MDCPAVTTSCCVSAWPLKLYLGRCHPRRSTTVEARGGQIQEQPTSPPGCCASSAPRQVRVVPAHVRMAVSRRPALQEQCAPPSPLPVTTLPFLRTRIGGGGRHVPPPAAPASKEKAPPPHPTLP